MTLVFGCLSFLQSEVGGSGYHYSPSAALFEQIHACKPIKTAKYIHGHWSHFQAISKFCAFNNLATKQVVLGHSRDSPFFPCFTP